MGKGKVLSEDDVVLPVANDVLGVAVKCQDDHERLCRIRSKMKRCVWIQQGDIFLVSPWDSQSDKRGRLFGVTSGVRLSGLGKTGT